MKFRQFLTVSSAPTQMYFKDGAKIVYPSQSKPLRLAILPGYDTTKPNPTSWVPAVVGDEESDFYTTIRAAKFVGHGNRRAKTSFLSPRTFDINADDPYEAFYDYCSRSDRWSYLTKAKRSRSLSGEVEGAVFPTMKNFFVANVIDVDNGIRSGVVLTELPESAAKKILYSYSKDGRRVNGIAFERDEKGNLVFGDITNPTWALVIEVAWGGRGYVARPAALPNGKIRRVEIPDTLLQHRRHMEDVDSFLVRPGSGQEIVDRIASLLRGYKSEDGRNEIDALKEAMDATYGKGRYIVDEQSGVEIQSDGRIDDSLDRQAEEVVESNPDEKSEAVDEAVERGVSNEKYTPVKSREEPENQVIPGEEISLDDIASVRAMLSRKKAK